MQVRTPGLGSKHVNPTNGISQWLMLAMVVGYASAARGGEERSTSADVVEPQKPKVEFVIRAANQRPAPTRIAVADQAAPGGRSRNLTIPADSSAATPSSLGESSVPRAIGIIAECRSRYEQVDDYTCTFYKRERIGGRMIPQHVMLMKVRTKPHSVYFKFYQPTRGREAIFIAGRHGNKVLAHDVGLNKILAGTLALEPTSARAMEDCRHPISEAGIGHLLETLAGRWAVELDPQESKVRFHDNLLVGERRCKMIETVHPHKRPEFLHHMVRVYVDQELNLPIHFEAYDWAKKAGTDPELTEEYSYSQLKLNVGLHEADFDTGNSAYSFGRF